MFNKVTVVESFKIPWLIWIQLIVLFLLLALLFFVVVVPLDSDHDSAAAAVTFLPSASTPFLFDEIQQIHDSTPTLRHLNQGAQNQNVIIKDEVSTDASSSMSGEEIEGDVSSLNPNPCHYFRLATVAFLKCFGLDSMSDCSSNPKSRKRKES
uniref:Uncharacterized protein n=1 Tax=Lotus japonicus TaxID=34305 RepID=I3SIK1_LOTJA|nr:unknown [Lotus japonicus]